MVITKRDVLAPANFVTIVGLALTIIGSMQLYSVFGFFSVAAGRLLDLLDGPVARHTHSSRFGAVLDATVDKLSILAIVLGLFGYALAPLWIVAYILLQNALVATLNIYSASQKIVIETVLTGKRNLFFQITSMLGFALANLAEGLIQTALYFGSYAAFAISVTYAIRATFAYIQKQKIL